MLARLFIAAIKLYQLTLSRLWSGACRFEPSCSRYAVACLEGHGAVRGSLLSIVRVCKCHPFHPGGYDPPPPSVAALPLPHALAPGSPGRFGVLLPQRHTRDLPHPTRDAR